MVSARIEGLDLARRCTAGDAVALSELFRAQRTRVHATLFRVLGSNSEIDDLVQEAFIEIYRSLGSFRGESLLSTWVDRIAVRVALHHLARRRADPVRLAIVAEPASSDAPSDRRVEAREAARRLYAILDKVPSEQRVAYTLLVIDGRSLEDVARAMDTTRVTAKVRAWRASQYVAKRARLDPLLASYLTEEETP